MAPYGRAFKGVGGILWVLLLGLANHTHACKASLVVDGTNTPYCERINGDYSNCFFKATADNGLRSEMH